MKKAILVTLLASTLGLGAVAVHADDASCDKRGGHGYSKHEGGKHEGGKHHGKRGGGHHGGGNMMKRMEEKLSLTDDQKAQIKTLREEGKTQYEALREEMKTFRTKMKALDTTSADYESQVVALADEKAALDRKQFIQRSEARKKFEAVLTAEQRTKMKEMKESRKSRGNKSDDKEDDKSKTE